MPAARRSPGRARGSGGSCRPSPTTNRPPRPSRARTGAGSPAVVNRSRSTPVGVIDRLRLRSRHRGALPVPRRDRCRTRRCRPDAATANLAEPFGEAAPSGTAHTPLLRFPHVRRRHEQHATARRASSARSRPAVWNSSCRCQTNARSRLAVPRRYRCGSGGRVRPAAGPSSPSWRPSGCAAATPTPRADASCRCRAAPPRTPPARAARRGDDPRVAEHPPGSRGPAGRAHPRRDRALAARTVLVGKHEDGAAARVSHGGSRRARRHGTMQPDAHPAPRRPEPAPRCGAGGARSRAGSWSALGRHERRRSPARPRSTADRSCVAPARAPRRDGSDRPRRRDRVAAAPPAAAESASDVVLAHGGWAAQVAALASRRHRPAGGVAAHPRLLGPGHDAGAAASWWQHRVRGASTPRSRSLPRWSMSCARSGSPGRCGTIRNFRSPGTLRRRRPRRSEHAAARGAGARARSGAARPRRPPDRTEAAGTRARRRWHACARPAPTSHLVVAGTGPLETAFVAEAGTLVLDAVRASCSATATMSRRCSVRLDLLLLTSEAEGIPGIVIEAQMAGCPVVTYPVGAVATCRRRRPHRRRAAERRPAADGRRGRAVAARRPKPVTGSAPRVGGRAERVLDRAPPRACVRARRPRRRFDAGSDPPVGDRRFDPRNDLVEHRRRATWSPRSRAPRAPSRSPAPGAARRARTECRTRSGTARRHP